VSSRKTRSEETVGRIMHRQDNINTCLSISNITINIYLQICFLWRISPWWASASSLSRLHDHIHRHTTLAFLWASDQPDAETSITTPTTNIYAPGVIRTQDPSKRAAENPPLRPRGHWDRLMYRQNTFIFLLNISIFYLATSFMVFQCKIKMDHE